MTFQYAMRCELGRLFLGRRFLYMLVISVALTLWLSVNGSMGFMGSAPFSQISYGALFSSQQVILACLCGLLCYGCFRREELLARGIILSTPVRFWEYMGAKALAVAAATLLALLLTAAVWIGGNLLRFGARWGTVLDALPAIGIIVLPALLFALGVSLALGRIRGPLIFVFLALFFVFGMVNLGAGAAQAPWWDPFGNGVFTHVDMIIAVRDRLGAPLIEVLPASFLWGRVMYAGIGAVALIGAVGLRSVR